VNVTESAAAAAFYAGLGLAVWGAIVLARRAVERRPAGARRGAMLLAAGLAAIAFALAVYVTGPRRVLPF
jgi:hypothetical protein